LYWRAGQVLRAPISTNQNVPCRFSDEPDNAVEPRIADVAACEFGLMVAQCRLPGGNNQLSQAKRHREHDLYS
jgi:hypothetical protein